MNRIAGIFNFDQTPVRQVELDRMTDVMKPRNQDEPRFRVDGNVGFACISTGNQIVEKDDVLPYTHSNQQGTIVFDGRIDNRQELVAVLKSQLSSSYEPISDQAIILAAYERWGLDFPKHLIGDFAFAIWDKRENRLICARDHFGVKPFYYHLSEKAFLFASTPQVILASRMAPFVINEERIADHLVNPLEGVDKTSSFYRDIFRLPPAHMLIVQSGGLSMRRYWELSPAVRSGLNTENDFIEAFQELFTEAVCCRLDGVAPASMLSGGMDSSSITGMGRRILTEKGAHPLHAFAVISNSPDTNRETPHILSVLDQGNLQSHLISQTGLSQWMGELVKTIETESEPFDCLMNLNRTVYLHARDRGINALLDGIDGDVLLSGSGHLTQLWSEGAVRTILEETCKAEGLTAEYKMGRGMFWNSLLSVLLPSAPDWLRKLRQPYRTRRLISSAVHESIIDRDFANRSRLGKRFATLDSHKPYSRSFRQMERHKIALDHPFLTVGLERYERVASAFGIQARHPLTDVRLAEFCLALPWHLKTRRGWTKYILRRAMEPYLPSEVVWRRDKDSLMWEFNRLILKERADYFHQTTLDERENLKPYVDVQKLENFWHEYLAFGNENHSEMLWSGVALAFWLRQQGNMSAGYG
jgi:asparagine synthase (glutamine-hydrolysing)